ncbi:VOC family protein [Neolewinella persica]|uniref:VOC family protein n=1 Tax=Neolewinella persica TaxID=70998 RepID=UPI0003672659|nr:VOC family protein [Neolewinella persica]
MPPFKLSHLDHVAVRATDPALSIEWYENVLGLKQYRLEAWGEFPVFMLSGKVGVAIFPAKEGPSYPPNIGATGIDHFAFNVSNQDFTAAQQHYKALGLSYSFQDHHYFHSIYTKDPDGHIVELTTQVLEDHLIYG